MEHNNSITLKEHFEARLNDILSEIGHIREIMAKEKEILLTKEGANDKALLLQFKENERRLDALNHEAQRLALMVPRAEFELVVDSLKKDKEDMAEEISILQLWKANVEGRQARQQLIAICATIVSLAALLLSIFR